jgi:hypothetical protein
MKNNNVRRHTLQTAIAPAIQTALDGVTGLDLNRAEDQRRLMRAAVHVVAGMLLEKGANPNVLAEASLEALSKELANLAAQHADGTFPVAGAEA